MQTLAGLSLLLALIWPASAQEYRREAPKRSLCTLLRHRNSYRNAIVEVDGGVLADGRHGITLTDDSCPQEGLPLDYPMLNADKSVPKFESLITESGTPGTIGRRVTGQFIGKVLLDSKTHRLSFALKRVITVEASPAPSAP
jgi:hypothetical protein